MFSRPSLKSRGQKAAAAVALLMAVPPLFVVFLPNVAGLSAAAWGVLLVSALCNGILEEVFWRGVFVHHFSTAWRAYVFPCACFVLWHVTLATLPGMHYHGGWPSLIGGAVGFGIVWGFVSWKQRSVFVTMIAHVLVNFFAFAGLIRDNWPG